MKLDAIFYQKKLEVIAREEKFEYHIGELSCRVAAGEVEKFMKWFPNCNWKSLEDVTKQRLMSLVEFKTIESEDEDLNMLQSIRFGFISGLYGEPFSVTKEMMFDGKKASMVDKYCDLDDFYALLVLDMVYAIDRNVKFVKCTKCGNIFIAKIEGTMYCNDTTGRIGCKREATRFYKEKVKANPVLNEFERLYQTVYHQKIRTTDEKEKRRIDSVIAEMFRLRNAYVNENIDKEYFIREIVRIRNTYCMRKVSEEEMIKKCILGGDKSDKII